MSSPADQASIPCWRGGTTAGVTSHPISTEQARREEGTERDSRRISAWFSSLQMSLLPATQRRPHPDRGRLPRAPRGTGSLGQEGKA